ncbi:MAG: menaquinone biosynthesis protein [Phycisphaerae bacterium]|nr:menaquinone biosynthesis protein [Phycisphaerae bacterium]
MLRLGVVSFLNARPLIDGLDESRGVRCVFDVPAALPARLDRREVDAALIPIVDLLRGNGRYRIVSDACIGCDGETLTVRVFSRVPPNRIRSLWVDPDSHTSVALAGVLWRQLFERDLILQPLAAPAAWPAEAEAVLLIGDKVVDPGRAGFGYEVDLGGAWRQHTGLPFVFAVWACLQENVATGLRPGRSTGKMPVPHPDVAAGLRPGRSTGKMPVPHPDVAAGLRPGRPTGKMPVPHPDVAAGLRTGRETLSELLAQARDRGVARAAEIAATDGPALGWPVALARRYLTTCLQYQLDARAVEGANLFARLCAEADLVPTEADIRWPESLLERETDAAL